MEIYVYFYNNVSAKLHYFIKNSKQLSSSLQKNRNYKKTSPPHFLARNTRIYRGFGEGGVL